MSTCIAQTPCRGISVLLVEHSMKVVMSCCQRIAVLDYGVKISDGAPAAVRSDPRSTDALIASAIAWRTPSRRRSCR